MFAGRFLPKLGGSPWGAAAFLPIVAHAVRSRVRQAPEAFAGSLPLARAFCKVLSRLTWQADAGSTRLLANFVCQPEQGPVQPQFALLVQLHHAPQQPAR